MTAKLRTPGEDHRHRSRRLPARPGARLRRGRRRSTTAREDAIAASWSSPDGLGADIAIEAVGVPETFELCTELIRPGGRVANVGVHGQPATLHLEKLWIRDVTDHDGLVDTSTTPKLLKLIEGGRLDPTPFATHRFPLEETMEAYDVFGDARRRSALKVVLSAVPVEPTQNCRRPRPQSTGA